MSTDSRSHHHLKSVSLEPDDAKWKFGFPDVSRLKHISGDFDCAYLAKPIHIRPLGTEFSYTFSTYEISANSIFVICHDIKKYGFKRQTTLLEVLLDLGLNNETKTPSYVQALAKIIEIFADEQEKEAPPGFILKIVQIEEEHHAIITSTVRTHQPLKAVKKIQPTEVFH